MKSIEPIPAIKCRPGCTRCVQGCSYNCSEKYIRNDEHTEEIYNDNV